MQIDNNTLITLAKSLDSVAYALHNFCVKTLEALGETPTAPATPAAASTSTAESAPAEAEPPTLEDVRAVFTEKTRVGHTKELKALLENYGVSKLTQLTPEFYPDILKDVHTIGGAE